MNINSVFEFRWNSNKETMDPKQVDHET